MYKIHNLQTKVMYTYNERILGNRILYNIKIKIVHLIATIFTNHYQ